MTKKDMLDDFARCNRYMNCYLKASKCFIILTYGYFCSIKD